MRLGKGCELHKATTWIFARMQIILSIHLVSSILEYGKPQDSSYVFAICLRERICIGVMIPGPQESTVHGMQTSAQRHPGHPVTSMSQGFQGYVRAEPDLRRPAVVWSVAESAPSSKETWRRRVGRKSVCFRVVFPIWAWVPAGLGRVLELYSTSHWGIESDKTPPCFLSCSKYCLLK